MPDLTRCSTQFIAFSVDAQTRNNYNKERNNEISAATLDVEATEGGDIEEQSSDAVQRAQEEQNFFEWRPYHRCIVLVFVVMFLCWMKETGRMM